MTSLLVPACPATLARLTMWPHCWSNISGRKACDEIWDQELLFGGFLCSRLHLDRPKVSQHVDLKGLQNPDCAQNVIL